MKRRHFWIALLADGTPIGVWCNTPPLSETRLCVRVAGMMDEDRVVESNGRYFLEVEANVFVNWAGGTTTRKSDRALFVCADDARAFAREHGWEIVE